MRYKKVKEFKVKIPDEIEAEPHDSGYMWASEEMLIVFKDGRIFVYHLVAVYEQDELRKPLSQVII